METISYDVFTTAFLLKIMEYEFASIEDAQRTEMVDTYMKRAIADFRSICKYDLSTTASDELRIFDVDIKDEDMDEIIDIVTEGMVVQWLKPFVYKQENLELALNTRDFTTYSPAELLRRVGEAYKQAQRDFVNMQREYSYRHGDLTVLHL